MKINQQRGKHCFVEPYKNNRVLKIFDFKPATVLLNDFDWGDPPRKGTKNPRMNVELIEATKIQNYAWMHGLAPRVYSIKKVKRSGHYYWAQEQDYAGYNASETIQEAREVYHKVLELGQIYGFKNQKNDVSCHDVIDGKLVDFNTIHRTDTYIETIKNLYGKIGAYGKKYYHNVPEMGLTGAPRDTEKRIKQMQLTKKLLRGKTVLDIGCSNGAITRVASKLGAKHVLGIDHGGFGSEDPVRAAQIISNELGYWEIDYQNMDINKQKPEPADIVFYLSINYHKPGIRPWLAEVTNELCIFEDNSKERNAKDTLETMFSKVELIGNSTDHDSNNPKLIYYCWK
jgi:hypothetical protein